MVDEMKVEQEKQDDRVICVVAKYCMRHDADMCCEPHVRSNICGVSYCDDLRGLECVPVSKPTAGFAPITITIETEEEATLMYGSLNTSMSGKNGAVDFGAADKGDCNLKMWQAFRDVYDIYDRRYAK